MRYQIKKQQQLNCSIDRAWEFFSMPSNLAKITPQNMGFKVLDNFQPKEIHEGMIINYIIKPIFNIPIKWQTIITQVDFRKSFTDFQQKGPYKLWNHYHEFIVNEKGVLMKDTVDYVLPFGILGVISKHLLIGKKLESIFEYRKIVLDKLFNET
jgi:ligand-binding SRPBCC domain-containing protein